MNGIMIDVRLMGLITNMFIAIICVIIFGIVSVIWLSRKNHKEINRMNEYIANINISNTVDIPALFEGMVQETFQEYLMIHGEYVNIDYISEETESKIMKDLGKMVSNRISPAMLDKISLHYNLQHIGEIISDKIYINVTAYSIEKNKPKEKVDRT